MVRGACRIHGAGHTPSVRMLVCFLDSFNPEYKCTRPERKRVCVCVRVCMCVNMSFSA